MTLDSFLIKFQKVPASGKIFFLQNLSVMIKTGVPLAEAIQTLVAQTANKKLKKILSDLYENIKKGKTLSEGLAPYQADFGEMFINMIKAGEASGNLEEVMNKLYLETKKDHELKTKVRNAMTYPSIIVVAMLGIGLFAIFFVLPNITGLFKDLKIELPWTTRLLLGLSDFVSAHGLITAVSSLISLAVIVKLLSTVKGKVFMDNVFIRLPVLSPIVKKINQARIARSLSSLLKTDIPIDQSLLITSRTLGNYLYRGALAEAAEEVKKGNKLQEVFKKHPKIFTPVIIQMVAIGEETGALEEVLENLAGFYEEEVEQTMETLPTIIEPILMLAIGGAVMVVALAILMPIYSLTENF